MLFPLFHRVYNHVGENPEPTGLLTLDEVLDYQGAGFAEACRYILELRGDPVEAKEAKRESLPVIEAQNGTGVLFFDFDDLPYKDYAAHFKAMPWCLAVMESPRGSIHVFAPGDHTPELYTRALEFWQFLGYNPDPACRNRTRLKFLFRGSLPPHHNPNAHPIEAFLPGAADFVTKAAEAIRTAPDGQKHYTRNKMGFTVGGMVTDSEADKALALLVEAARSNTTNPQLAQREVEKAFKDGQRQPMKREERPTAALAEVLTVDVLRQSVFSPDELTAEEMEVRPLVTIEHDTGTASLLNFGEVVVVMGQAKSRKSFFIRSILQALSGRGSFGPVSLLAHETVPVWYFDTEQTKRDIAVAYQAMPTGPNVTYHNLLPYDPATMRAAILKALKTYPKGCMVIDNILDLGDFNQLDQAVEVAQALTNYVSNTGGVVLGVVHMNYHTKGEVTKAQGHMGSLLYRKAHLVINLHKKGREWHDPTEVQTAQERGIRPWGMNMQIEDGRPVYTMTSGAPINRAAFSMDLDQAAREIAARPGMHGAAAGVKAFEKVMVDYFKEKMAKAPSREDLENYRRLCPFLIETTYNGKPTKIWQSPGQQQGQELDIPF